MADSTSSTDTQLPGEVTPAAAAPVASTDPAASTAPVIIPTDSAATPAPDSSMNTVPEPMSAPTDATPQPTVSPAPSEPLVITEAEAAGTPANGAAVGDEIEMLQGEIQALGSKIDRLVGSSTTVAETSPSKPETPLEAEVRKEPKEKEEPEKSIDVPIAKPEPEPTPPPAPVEEPKKSVIQDIAVQKKTQKENENKIKDMKDDDLSELTGGEPSSALATIAEVVATLGVLVFLILMLSPFFKGLLGASFWSLVKSIGWITALATIGIGFVLYLFVKGKTSMKILLGVFVVLAALMFLGTGSQSSWLGPVSSLFAPLFGYYK